MSTVFEIHPLHGDVVPSEHAGTFSYVADGARQILIRPPPSDGKSKSALEDCGRLAWTLATHVRRRSVELLARALPHGVDAQRAAESLGLQGPDDLEAWLATEFPNQALLRGDRLDCAKVCACFAEEQAQVAQREEASRRDTELSTFVVSHEEVLKRAEQKKAAKAASKAEKKAKKEKKREKKRAKKEKKRQKKEKKENRTAKKAKPGLAMFLGLVLVDTKEGF
ncbi:unnamed protein product [Effrenium voratum]|uniref:Uncharacterized protein n=1 Tax=Effrenium voratum TaxID=2562239 RepID=A0AA36MYG8_9DINO|nr:unnamed protein product [Effrenium voratum]